MIGLISRTFYKTFKYPAPMTIFAPNLEPYCEVSNWFKSVVFFACASAAIAAYFCFRCNADRVSNFVAGMYF